ncbi:hypothetical protein F2P56_002298, partial [Juglans regia]
QTPINTLNHEARVATLIEEGSCEWKKDLVKAAFNENEAKIICSLPIIKRRASDRLIWRGSGKGGFTVKSAYYMETERLHRMVGKASTRGRDNRVWKEVCQLEVPDKVKMFIWKCHNNILPTKDNLNRKNIIENNICLVCLRESGTLVHVLWECLAAANVWGGENILLSKWKGQLFDFHFLWNEMRLKLSKEIVELVLVMFYQRWVRRNAFIFQNQFSKPESIGIRA